MTRADGEKARLVDHIANLRGLLEGLEMCVAGDVPTTAAAQSVAEAAVRVAMTCSRLDAYGFASRDVDRGRPW